MTTLAGPLRKQLEKTVEDARTEAVKAARAALTTLAVDRNDPFASMSETEKALRRLLREKQRQLGDFDALVQAVAYEQWHRMLFARFLAENNLLIHPEHGVSVSLADCAELAADEGEPDGWMVAAKYAATMLPGIFKTTDPLLRVRFAAEGRQALETLLGGLPSAVFTAEDSLGWVYQFWQSEKKAEVNRSGRKIGGADIPPVTQLFTEPYMVQFLLHNTLGAWWASRHPDDDLAETFTYLRVNADGTPIAGDFPGWPGRVAELRVLDPCCGSGHFLVAAFEMLREMRMREEGLSTAGAGDAVLRDNLFGLEIDPRCTEIAAFALALTAWKAGGYRRLPIPHVACSGIPVGDRLYNWTSIAGGDFALESNLRALYTLFQQAADLGSLIDPTRDAARTGSFFDTRFEDILPHLERLLAKDSLRDDPSSQIFGDVVAGVSHAASMLAQKYHLVMSNVPYLKRGKQDNRLRQHLTTQFPDGKADLATAFVERCGAFCCEAGVYALVTPQSWLFQDFSKGLRRHMLQHQSWSVVARLGANAFESIGGEVVNVALVIIANAAPESAHRMFGLDASSPKTASGKASSLLSVIGKSILQSTQLENPDSRVVLETMNTGTLLEDYVRSINGMTTGDIPRLYRFFWELYKPDKDWARFQSTLKKSSAYAGREGMVYWCNGRGPMTELPGAFKRGQAAWGKNGIVVSQMGDLPVTVYTGELFDVNTAVLLPYQPEYLLAVWAYCSSEEFHKAVRRIDQKLKVTNATLVKVPFDLER